MSINLLLFVTYSPSHSSLHLRLIFYALRLIYWFPFGCQLACCLSHMFPGPTVKTRLRKIVFPSPMTVSHTSLQLVGHSALPVGVVLSADLDTSTERRPVAVLLAVGVKRACRGGGIVHWTRSDHPLHLSQHSLANGNLLNGLLKARFDSEWHLEGEKNMLLWKKRIRLEELNVKKSGRTGCDLVLLARSPHWVYGVLRFPFRIEYRTRHSKISN